MISLFILLLATDNGGAGSLIFTCGNHDPQHSATIFEEAKKLTIKYHCANWFVGSTESSLGSEHQFNEMRARLAKVLQDEIAKEKEKTTRN
jgi:hypothetical protein